MIDLDYIVHSTSTDNEKGIASGWRDCELSEIGTQQSFKLKSLLSGKSYDLVYCSDLKRAVQTAQNAFGASVKIIQDARLRECNYGEFNGMPKSVFKENMVQYVNKLYPNGESYEEVAHRVSDFIATLKVIHQNERVAIISHHAPQLALEVIVHNKSWQEALDNDWRNTGNWSPTWNYIIK
ncbi:MAG: histidine phosphatase family protein [Bacteroidota bacterium]|nr:histidine phosphatase family protein [uncultured Allomuricauda sp.]